MHGFHHGGISLLRTCRYALTSPLGLTPERAHGDLCQHQHPGLSDTLLSSWRVTPDGASTQSPTAFSVGVAMEDTPYQTLRRPGDQSPRLHGASAGRGPPRQNMHKYPSLVSNTLLLLHSFPAVTLGVATEGPMLKTE